MLGSGNIEKENLFLMCRVVNISSKYVIFV